MTSAAAEPATVAAVATGTDSTSRAKDEADAAAMLSFLATSGPVTANKPASASSTTAAAAAAAASEKTQGGPAAVVKEENDTTASSAAAAAGPVVTSTSAVDTLKAAYEKASVNVAVPLPTSISASTATALAAQASSSRLSVVSSTSTSSSSSSPTAVSTPTTISAGGTSTSTSTSTDVAAAAGAVPVPEAHQEDEVKENPNIDYDFISREPYIWLQQNERFFVPKLKELELRQQQQKAGVITKKPRSFDVLCGRGGETNHHPGNVRYRQLVKAYQRLYVDAPRRDKPKIAQCIVYTIRISGGRFLKREVASNAGAAAPKPTKKTTQHVLAAYVAAGKAISSEDKDSSSSRSAWYHGAPTREDVSGANAAHGLVWVDVGNSKAREKTSQALREGAPELRNNGGGNNDNNPADGTKNTDGILSVSTSGKSSPTGGENGNHIHGGAPTASNSLAGLHQRHTNPSTHSHPPMTHAELLAHVGGTTTGTTVHQHPHTHHHHVLYNNGRFHPPPNHPHHTGLPADPRWNMGYLHPHQHPQHPHHHSLLHRSQSGGHHQGERNVRHHGSPAAPPVSTVPVPTPTTKEGKDPPRMKKSEVSSTAASDDTTPTFNGLDRPMSSVAAVAASLLQNPLFHRLSPDQQEQILLEEIQSAANQYRKEQREKEQQKQQQRLHLHQQQQQREERTSNDEGRHGDISAAALLSLKVDPPQRPTAVDTTTRQVSELGSSTFRGMKKKREGGVGGIDASSPSSSSASSISTPTKGGPRLKRFKMRINDD